MEEVIKQIEIAERDAAQLVAEANSKAAGIIASIDGKLEELRDSYEQKLKADYDAILSSAKARVNKMRLEQEKIAEAKCNKIKSDASAKIKPCVDFVYDFIMKEYAE